MKIGIVGATGAVGTELIQVLEKRNFPVSSLLLFASERSAGKQVTTERFGTVTIQVYSLEAAKALDVVFFAASGGFALKHAKELADCGPVVIDNSSAFRYDEDVPLIVPEINADALQQNKLIANPNCTTAIAVLALWPIHQLCGLKKVIVSTYQAASGAGAEGMTELREGTEKYLSDPTTAKDCKVFAHPLPFNVIPHIDKFQDNAYTREEMKVVWETRKICSLKDLPISCTAVRIPTFRAHAEAITVEVEKPVDITQVREKIAAFPGVKVVDNPEKCAYPMPINATDAYDVEVGRIRKNLAFDNGIDLFVCGDQLLRGAALNAVLIAELVLSQHKDNKRPKLNGDAN